MDDKTYQAELGRISNRITDLTIQGAPPEEIQPLIEESRRIMDQKKLERLDYWTWVEEQMSEKEAMTTPYNTKPKKLNKGIEKLKEAWNENPIGVCIVAAAVMTAAGKLIDSVSSYQSKRAYAEEARSRARR